MFMYKELQQGTGKIKICYPTNDMLEMHYWVTKKSTSANESTAQINTLPMLYRPKFLLT